ncbi:MAG: MFS transporter, partial [Brevibacterium sp.]|nr:MFS transporter [Brevibacterium sp.]
MAARRAHRSKDPSVASVLTRSAIVAPKNFNRWLIPPAALAIHLCIGQVYAFSVFK